MQLKLDYSIFFEIEAGFVIAKVKKKTTKLKVEGSLKKEKEENFVSNMSATNKKAL